MNTMKMNPKLNRKIFGSLMIIGLVALAAGATTTALFSDTEASTNNTFTAGGVDLEIGWDESYNGELIEEQPVTSNVGPIFEISDVKPGDEGEATITLENYGNPSYVWMNTKLTSNDDMSSTEPELEVDAQNDPNNSFDGELAQHIQVNVWYDDGDNIYQEDEEIIYGGTVENSQTCTINDIDNSLVLDRSGSMSTNGKLTAAQDGASTLVNKLGVTDQNALVSFADAATLDQQLTMNDTLVIAAINNMTAAGQTNIADGIATGHTELVNGTNARSSAVKTMVVLSNGQANIDGNAIAEADAAKADGIRIITIALGEGADTEGLELIASSEGDAYVAPSADELETVFADIADEICEDSTSSQNATLAGLAQATEEGLLLDADPSTSEVDGFAHGEANHIGFSWTLPEDVGNVVQTDSTTFDLNFYAEQMRHNDGAESPWM